MKNFTAKIIGEHFTNWQNILSGAKGNNELAGKYDLIKNLLESYKQK